MNAGLYFGLVARFAFALALYWLLSAISDPVLLIAQHHFDPEGWAVYLEGVRTSAEGGLVVDFGWTFLASSLFNILIAPTLAWFLFLRRRLPIFVGIPALWVSVILISRYLYRWDVILGHQILILARLAE